MQGVLYYPHIRVPTNAWFTQVLLYWDDVATIVPYGISLDHPEFLDDYTAELLQEELIEPIAPWQSDLDELAPLFQQWVVDLSPDEVDARRTAFNRGGRMDIHTDKVEGELVQMLSNLGLAQAPWESAKSSIWMQIERRTAGEYMAALAMKLSERQGQSDQTHRVPITDQEVFLDALASTGTDARLIKRTKGMHRYEETRALVLRSVLPVPDHFLKAKDIKEFRLKHDKLLPDFRRWLEERIKKIAKSDDIDRELLRFDLEQEFKDAVKDVTNALSAAGAVDQIIRKDFVKLIEVIPVAGAIVRFLEFIAGSKQQPKPLAYAAFADAELLDSKTSVLSLVGPRIWQSVDRPAGSL